MCLRAAVGNHCLRAQTFLEMAGEECSLCPQPSALARPLLVTFVLGARAWPQQPTDEQALWQAVPVLWLPSLIMR